MLKFNSLRSLSNYLSNNPLKKSEQAPKTTNSIKALILPGSIQSDSDIHVDCLNWALGSQPKRNPANVQVYMNNLSLANLSKVDNQEINHSSTIWTRIPQLFVNVNSVQLKSALKMKSIYCKVTCNNQEYYTSKISLVDDGQGNMTSAINLGYLFDLNDIESCTLQIEIYSLTNQSSDRLYLPKFGSIKRMGTLIKSTSSLSLKENAEKVPQMDFKKPEIEGKLIASMNLSISNTRNTPKFTETYLLASNNREIGSVTFELGVNRNFFKKYHTLVVHQGFVNVSVHTVSTMVWKKYWACLKNGIMTFYDFEYQKRRPAIGSLRVTEIDGFASPKPDSFNSPNIIQIKVKPLILDSKELTQLQWLKSIMDSDQQNNSIIYMMGDSVAGIDAWKKALLDSMQQ